MFDDIINEFVPIHKDIFKAAVEWAEYVLQQRVNKRQSVDVGGLKNEMKELLSIRLSKFWWREYEASLNFTEDKRVVITFKEANNV
jgi:hypothetical protein